MPLKLFFLIIIVSASYCQKITANSTSGERGILLALTGFTVEKNSIEFNELKQQFCENKIYVLPKALALGQKIFRCEGPPNKNEIENKKVLPTSQAFSKLAKNNILLTTLEEVSPLYKALAINSVDFFDNAKNYPLQNGYSQDELAKFPQKITRLSITGVTALTRGSGHVADKKGASFLIEKIKHHFAQTDIMHISNEVSFTKDCVYPAQRTFRFCTKKEHFEVFKELKTNIVELTGNHNRDFGDPPFIETFHWYQQNGIKTFGGGLNPKQANEPLIVALKDGKKIGFIGFNETCPIKECALKPNEPGANVYEKNKARVVIDQMRRVHKVDYVIASVQFSEVDSYKPHAKQRQISYDLIDMGADIVYGSQAHQIQQIEFYKHKIIYHGLGNFLFDQIHRIGVRQAYFMHLLFYQGRHLQTKMIFTFMNEERQIVEATSEERKIMQKEIYDDSLIYR